MLGLFVNRNNSINVQTTPDLPAGVAFRPCQGEEDFPAISVVVIECQEVDQIDLRSQAESIPTGEEIARTLGTAAADELAERVLIVEAEDRVIGYNIISWWDEPDHTRVYHHRGYLIPRWRNLGIGSAMFQWAEEQIVRLADRQVYPGKVVVGTGATSTERNLGQLLFKRDYMPHRRFSELVIDLQQHRLAMPYLPLGFELRPVESKQIEPIREMINADQGLPAGEGDCHCTGFDPSFWQVAWQDGHIAGVVCAEDCGEVAQITAITIAPDHQGSGLARALLLHTLHGLKVRGFGQARLITGMVLQEGNDSLYSSVGFREVKVFTHYRKEIAQG